VPSAILPISRKRKKGKGHGEHGNHKKKVCGLSEKRPEMQSNVFFTDEHFLKKKQDLIYFY
jgi:hypothetical protein